MKRALLLSILLSLTILLLGCGSKTDGGGGFDLVALVHNPVVMAIIVIVVLWYMLKKK